MPLRPQPVSARAAFGLPLVWLLTALAGAVDACGVAVMHDLYVSFMSGNTTALGRALAGADWSWAGLIAEIIAAFVAGVAAGTILARRAGRYRLPAVMLAVGLLLALFDPFDPRAIPFLCFAMGALNAALQQADGMPISITYVTGTLVRLGQGIAQVVCGETGDWRWAEHATLWSALLAGVTAAAALQSTHPAAVRIVLPAATLGVASTTFAAVWRAQRAVGKRQDR